MSPRAAHVMRVVLAAMVLPLLGAPVIASERVERGHALLGQHCGSCHATEKAGRSQHREAPPFRFISRRYDVDAIVDMLREGLVSYHRDMPDFRFSREDARAAGAYLRSIQE